jgi:hypothetical protein
MTVMGVDVLILEETSGFAKSVRAEMSKVVTIRRTRDRTGVAREVTNSDTTPGSPDFRAVS